MISSSRVSSDGTSASELFKSYSSEIESFSSDDVWCGKSKENASTQTQNFISEYSTPIDSQFSDFSEAVSKYEEWQKAKEEKEDAEDDLEKERVRQESLAAAAQQEGKNYTIDLSSYESAVETAKEKMEKLDEEIKDKLSSVVDNKLDISSNTVKTVDSYKLYDFVNYYQYNYQNAYGSDTIATCGCGPTSMAMVLTYLTGETVDPVEAADWSTNHGGYCWGQGTYWSYFGNISEAYGIECEQMGPSTSNITEQLQNGKTVIMSMGPGHFTSGGHYIVLRGLTDDGQVIVADPASEDRSNQTWSADLIASEAKQLWAFDGDTTADLTI